MGLSFVLRSLAVFYPIFFIAAATPEIHWVDCKDHVPPSDVFDPAGIDLENLPPTLMCGRIAVPMDYSQPLDGSNNITLGLAMHRPSNPKGIIFFSPGGSDNAVVHAWNFALGINSPFTPNFSGLGDPASQDEFEASKAASATAIQSWIEASSPPGIIKYVGTREVVEDFNQIREALGYEKIHYLGGS
ncbi:hypothetical protein LTR84_006604 [Exophiala bonariae]|uniref:Carboxylic ester hydrolase n=1 Tax=Exophiala bonariae TaxID=1690606 RepID=A0AAV9N386_9EURO|nr:hypothetical protein LTR84_006604 [Exophiala bonariae]